MNDRAVDPGLRIACAAPPWKREMQRFMAGYARHPVATAHRAPGEEAAAEQTHTVACGHGPTVLVALTWACFDGAWRAWPQSRVLSNGSCGRYRGCG